MNENHFLSRKWLNRILVIGLSLTLTLGLLPLEGCLEFQNPIMPMQQGQGKTDFKSSVQQSDKQLSDLKDTSVALADEPIANNEDLSGNPIQEKQEDVDTSIAIQPSTKTQGEQEKDFLVLAGKPAISSQYLSSDKASIIQEQEPVNTTIQAEQPSINRNPSTFLFPRRNRTAASKEDQTAGIKKQLDTYAISQTEALQANQHRASQERKESSSAVKSLQLAPRLRSEVIKLLASKGILKTDKVLQELGDNDLVWVTLAGNSMLSVAISQVESQNNFNEASFINADAQVGLLRMRIIQMLSNAGNKIAISLNSKIEIVSENITENKGYWAHISSPTQNTKDGGRSGEIVIQFRAKEYKTFLKPQQNRVGTTQRIKGSSLAEKSQERKGNNNGYSNKKSTRKKLGEEEAIKGQLSGKSFKLGNGDKVTFYKQGEGRLLKAKIKKNDNKGKRGEEVLPVRIAPGISLRKILNAEQKYIDRYIKVVTPSPTSKDRQPYVMVGEFFGLSGGGEDDDMDEEERFSVPTTPDISQDSYENREDEEKEMDVVNEEGTKEEQEGDLLFPTTPDISEDSYDRIGWGHGVGETEYFFPTTPDISQDSEEHTANLSSTTSSSSSSSSYSASSTKTKKRRVIDSESDEEDEDNIATEKIDDKGKEMDIVHEGREEQEWEDDILIPITPDISGDSYERRGWGDDVDELEHFFPTTPDISQHSEEYGGREKGYTLSTNSSSSSSSSGTSSSLSSTKTKKKRIIVSESEGESEADELNIVTEEVDDKGKGKEKEMDIVEEKRGRANKRKLQTGKVGESLSKSKKQKKGTDEGTMLEDPDKPSNNPNRSNKEDIGSLLTDIGNILSVKDVEAEKVLNLFLAKSQKEQDEFLAAAEDEDNAEGQFLVAECKFATSGRIYRRLKSLKEPLTEDIKRLRNLLYESIELYIKAFVNGDTRSEYQLKLLKDTSLFNDIIQRLGREASKEEVIEKAKKAQQSLTRLNKAGLYVYPYANEIKDLKDKYKKAVIAAIRHIHRKKGITDQKVENVYKAFLLDANKSFKNHTTFLKISDMIFMNVDRAKAPEFVLWGGKNSIGQQPAATEITGPLFVSKSTNNYDAAVMSIDTSSTGGDETAYCVAKRSGDYYFILAVGGMEGGYVTERKPEGHSDKVAEALIEIALEYGIKTVVVEHIHEKSFINTLQKKWIEKAHALSLDVNNLKFVPDIPKGEKEERIKNALWSLLSEHKLIMHNQALIEDLEPVPTKDLHYKFFYQLMAIRLKEYKAIAGGLLKPQHDDRLDAVAAAIDYLKKSAEGKKAFENKLKETEDRDNPNYFQSLLYVAKRYMKGDVSTTNSGIQIVEKDYKQALKFYEKFYQVYENIKDKSSIKKSPYKHDYSEALFSLGKLYEHGWEGLPKDPAKAKGLYTQASNLGNAAASYRLYNKYFKDELKNKGKSERVKQINSLIDLCREAKIDFPDGHEQLTESEKKRKQSEAARRYKLAKLYDTLSVEQIGTSEEAGSRNEARKFYLGAAKLGNKKAQYRSGILYRNENNLSGAFKLLEESAEQEYMPAQNMLGQMYYEINTDKEKDYPKAFGWTLRAALQDNPAAQCRLARMYKNTHGGLKRPDYQLALEWYLKAAKPRLNFKQKDEARKVQVYAFYKLGKMYEKGRGIEPPIKDFQKAKKYYKKASNLGQLEKAQFNLAKLYEEQGNTDLANVFYISAAKNGHERAKEKVNSIHSKYELIYSKSEKELAILRQRKSEIELMRLKAEIGRLVLSSQAQTELKEEEKGLLEKEEGLEKKLKDLEKELKELVLEDASVTSTSQS